MMPAFMSKKLLALSVLAVLALSACAEDAPLDTLEPAGRKAEDIDALAKPIYIISLIVMVAIFIAVFYIVRRFRVSAAGDGEEAFAGGYADEEFPEQNHGNDALEIGWTVVPAIVMALIAFWSVPVLLDLDDVEAAEGASYPNMEVVVVGQQWWWEYHYYLDGAEGADEPDFVTANEMVIPVEQDVRLWVTSRDVIHSFWIPRLNGKKDAVPGRVHEWVIQSNEIGRFAGTCTEFCGLSHAYMRMYTVAVSAGDFDVWVEGQMTPATLLAEGDRGYEGQQVFLNNCARCHVIDGVTERDRDGDGVAEPDDMAMYGNIEEFRDHSDGTLNQGMFTGESNLLAGAAPNMTHFASRSAYAGSFFELYEDAQEIAEAGEYLTLSESPYFRNTLEAWLANPPAVKPNAADQARGMPNLDLSQEQIDQLVEYLLLLD